LAKVGLKQQLHHMLIILLIQKQVIYPFLWANCVIQTWRRKLKYQLFLKN